LRSQWRVSQPLSAFQIRNECGAPSYASTESLRKPCDGKRVTDSPLSFAALLTVLFPVRGGAKSFVLPRWPNFYFPAPIGCLGEPGIGQLLVFRQSSLPAAGDALLRTHDAQTKFCDPGRFRWFGVCQVVKTAQSRERTERTLLTRWFWLSAGTLVEQRNAADRRDPSLSHFHLRSPESSCRQALMLFRRLAANARVERAGAGPNRAVVKAALTCGFLLP
jgi:hypothetical protein